MRTLRGLVSRALRPSVRWRLVLAFPFAIGCSSVANQVATHQNSYDFREARYEEHCASKLPITAGAVDTIGSALGDECRATVLELHAYEKHLHEAARAVKLGGKLPLQLAALKTDAKKLAKRAVTK